MREQFLKSSYVLSVEDLPVKNALAYWTHLLVTNKMKYCEYGPWVATQIFYNTSLPPNYNFFPSLKLFVHCKKAIKPKITNFGKKLC